jgi:hypothetical protein
VARGTVVGWAPQWDTGSARMQWWGTAGSLLPGVARGQVESRPPRYSNRSAPVNGLYRDSPDGQIKRVAQEVRRSDGSAVRQDGQDVSRQRADRGCAVPYRRPPAGVVS